MLTVLPVGVADAGAPGSTYYTSGNKLHSFCKEEDSAHFEAHCIGYILGVTDALNGWLILHSVVPFCILPSVDVLQLVDVVKQWLSKYPGQRHLPAPDLIARALSVPFSCK